MARIHLTLPGTYLFDCELPVRVSDLNYGGHVGNDRLLTFAQEARVLFYRQHGIESEVKIDGTIGQIITDAAVVYKAESFLGDVLHIQIGASDFNKYGFDFIYRVSNKLSGKEVAHIKTGVVCFDYEKRKVCSVPARLLDIIQVK